jgi:hypothetical protein
MNEAEKDILREWRERCLNELREAAQVAHVLLFPKVEHIKSPPPTRGELLKRAEATRSDRPKDRREQVLRIIEELPLSPEPISVGDIFEAVYGDPAGQEYWRLWLKFGSDAEVERLLVAHLSTEMPDVSPPPGWSWGPCCAVALARYPSGQLVDRIRSIAEDEELGYLVAPSARAFLDSDPREPHHAELAVGPNQGKRGPKESVMPRLLKEMRLMDCSRLKEMKHSEMAFHFGAAASTCTKARGTVLGNSR